VLELFSQIFNTLKLVFSKFEIIFFMCFWISNMRENLGGHSVEVNAAFFVSLDDLFEIF